MPDLDDKEVYQYEIHFTPRLGGLRMPLIPMDEYNRRAGFFKAIIGKKDNDNNFTMYVQESDPLRLYVTVIDEIIAAEMGKEILEIEASVVPLQKYHRFGFPIWLHRSLKLSMPDDKAES